MRNKNSMPFIVKAKNYRQPASVIITRHFDSSDSYDVAHGGSEREYKLSHPFSAKQEYNIIVTPTKYANPVSGALAAIPYTDFEIIQSVPTTVAPAPVSAPAAAPVQSPEPPRTPASARECPPDKHYTAAPVPRHEELNTQSENTGSAQAESAPMSINTPEAEVDKSKEDDEFFADMKAILEGKKRVPRPAEPEEDLPVSLPQSGQHAIFDQIAQSMQFANAYNLGDFDLEERFNQFDRLDQKIPASQVVKPASTLSVQADTSDFISDMDIIHQGQKSAGMALPPLSPETGGQSINKDALDPGDIILSTTDHPISNTIRGVTNAPVSHALIYIGNNRVMEAGTAGVIEISLDEALDNSNFAVAYRHSDMTVRHSNTVVRYLLDNTGKPFDTWGLIKVLPQQLMQRYCDGLGPGLSQICRAGADKIRIGTDTNDEFYCSELVFKALKSAGLDIGNIEPQWSTPNDVVRLNHNGKLFYIGHLKTT